MIYMQSRKWNASPAKVEMEQVFTKTTQRDSKANTTPQDVLEHYKYISKGDLILWNKWIYKIRF